MRWEVVTIVACLGLAGLPAGPALAEERTFAPAGIKLWMPDGWEAESEEDELILRDPADEASVRLVVLEIDKIDQALDELDKELTKVVDNLILVSKPKPGKVNGLKTSTLSGRAKLDGVAVKLEIMLLEAPTGKVVLIYALAEAGKYKKHLRKLDKLLQSVKKS